MQKVEGSNPFSRSRKGLHLQVFSWAQSACASASGRTDSGLAPGRSSAVPRKTPCLQADSGSSEPKCFCGSAEGRMFRLVRPLAGCSCKTARLVGLPGAPGRPQCPRTPPMTRRLSWPWRWRSLRVRNRLAAHGRRGGVRSQDDAFDRTDAGASGNTQTPLSDRSSAIDETHEPRARLRAIAVGYSRDSEQ